MKRIIFFLFFLPLIAKADWDQLFSEKEDLTLFHHVNVITGNLNLFLQDAMVEGPRPLSITRTYTSAGALERSENQLDLKLKSFRGGWLIQGGWNFFAHANLLIEPSMKKKYYTAYLSEKNGALIRYTYSHKVEKYIIALKPEYKSSQLNGTIGAKTNLENNLLHIDLKKGKATLFLPNGGTNHYSGKKLYNFDPTKNFECYYRLDTEILPSKHKIQYSYDGADRLNQIALTNPAGTKTYSWIHFDYIKTSVPFQFQATTSDGATFSYLAKDYNLREYFSEVQSNGRFHEKIEYTKSRKSLGLRLQSLHLADKEKFRVSYFTPPDKETEKKWISQPESKDFSADKVRCIETPIGPNGEFKTIATFTYHLGYTDARDVDHLLTRYKYDSNSSCLTSIEYFDDQDHLSSTLLFIWDGERLKSKVFLNEKKEPLFSKVFQYDKIGNVVEEVLWGNLTGNAKGPFSLNKDGSLKAAESYQKKYSYLPEFNLVTLEQEEGGLNYSYIYKKDTDLLTAKLTSHKGKILLREFYLYDDDHLLIAEITDDGSASNFPDLTNVTHRFIKRYTLDPKTGLKQTQTESYLDLATKEEVLLKKISYTYSPQHRIVREDLFDANEIHRYAIYTDYDNQGRVIRKTTPTGQENSYKYDVLGALLEKKEVGHLKQIYRYDFTGYPTSCEETDGAGKTKTTLTKYDLKGRLLSTTDSYGNITKQVYDCFGRCLETHFPEARNEDGNVYTPIVKFKYDIQGNLASTIMPKGEISEISYNIFRKPTQIVQSDGNKIFHFYNKNGTIQTTIYPDQTRIQYNYDLFQRMTLKEVYSVGGEKLSSESWDYTTFDLQSYTNPKGVKVNFFYDGAARKIEEDVSGRKKQYAYDSLGFLEKTVEGDIAYVQTHDINGRIVECWEEDEAGQVENLTSFSYDAENRKENATRLTSQGEAIDIFSYDGEGRLTSHTDPNNSVTKFIYDETSKNDLNQTILQKTSEDALGSKIVETYDVLHRLVQIEKKSSKGDLLSKEEFFYDPSGNKIKQITTSFYSGKMRRKTAISWEYDSMGRVIKEEEPNGKIIVYSYDSRGRISKKTFPNGTSLEYHYDGIDRLLRLTCSNGAIHYQFHYEQSHNPVLVQNLITNETWKRKYNLFDELVEEIQPNGNSFYWKYDQFGRNALFTLPDQSSIDYGYSGSHLVSVMRRSPDTLPMYEHRYTAFDPNGHVAQENLIYDLGTITTAHDLLERAESQITSWLTQSVSYGPTGLIIKKKNSLLGETEYFYDGLNQLIREGSQDHYFDSLGNPVDSTINDLNQILSFSGQTISYDPNGNPIERTSEGHSTIYDYDPLGQLTSLTYQNQKKIQFLYDPFSRLYAKEVYLFHNGEWQRQDRIYYLYDQEKEIGTIRENGEIVNLKVLGLGIKGDIGAAVAIEIDGEPFSPLHDFNGNILALIAVDKTIEEIYEIDAFGREDPFIKTINPWHFSSKRTEEGLIFFGRRFYDPFLKRWLTPDPAGFTDGPNLYLYVLNSPLNRLDLFGLFADPFSNPSDYSPSRPPLPTLIELSRQQILENSFNIAKLIPCKGIIGGANVDFLVSCGHWYKLEYTPEEINANKINLIDHLHELVPKQGFMIGLITSQNGMNTSLEELHKFNESIMINIPEGTLFVSLHNPTHGLWKDLERGGNELLGKETPIVALTRQFLVVLAEKISKINPKMLINHIAHSESGLVLARSIEGMTSEQKALLKEHLYAFTFGSVLPVSKEFTYDARNVYSAKDWMTKRYARPYLNNPNYDIRIVPCTSNWSQFSMLTADHSFSGYTCQKALRDDISDLRKKFGFYDGREKNR
ncbi:MAG: hypothetical protein L0207_01515 [Chlamydiae bacterium]|nr:hypothetical protein [Chlamydiota bacterium]